MTSTGKWYPPKGLQIVLNYLKDILPSGQPQSKDSDLEIQALGDFLGSAPPSPVVNSFKRMRSAKNGILHSMSYERVHCRNSFTVRVRTRQNTQEYGHIEFFFQTKPICFCLSATTCNCSVHNLAVLRRLRRCVAAKLIDDKNTNASCSHVNVVAAAQAGDIIVVDINQIESKCVFICLNDTSNICFVVDFPNTLETD